MVWGWIAAGVSEEVTGNLYEKAQAGESAPGWFAATMPSPAFAIINGWDSDNPVWHLWNWMASPEAGEGAGIALEQFPAIRQKMLERWAVEFWIPLYSAACDLSFPDYAASLKAIFPTVEKIFDVYGRDFVSSWYADVVETDVGEILRFRPISAEEYVRRRAELGCPLQSISGSAVKIPPTTERTGDVALPLEMTKQFPWSWVLFGTIVVGAAVATTLYVRNPKRKSRGRRKKK